MTYRQTAWAPRTADGKWARYAFAPEKQLRVDMLYPTHDGCFEMCRMAGDGPVRVKVTMEVEEP